MTPHIEFAAHQQNQLPGSDGTITVAQILDQYDSWGIPHFQRGSVWGPDNVSALLESLYWDTPCGSIILWTPNEIKCHGVPLVPGRTFTHLIIDGQQRTRSVYAAFKGLFEPVDDADESDDTRQTSSPQDGPARFWAINLNEVREFEDFIGAPGKRPWPLFVKIPDPHASEQQRLRKEKEAKEANKRRWNIPESPFKYNFVPLKFFNGSDFASLLEERQFFLKNLDPHDPVALARVLERLETLRLRVQEMKERRLFRRELGREFTLDAALHVFIRINSGGRPVQEEEKGFSVLVGKSPSTSTWVKSIFDQIHPDAEPTEHLDLERDESLRRINERAVRLQAVHPGLRAGCHLPHRPRADGPWVVLRGSARPSIPARPRKRPADL
jgi:hypothetical protein